MKLSDVQSLLVCPYCRSRVDVHPEELSQSGTLIAGDIVCPRCAIGVAKVERSQINFHVDPFSVVPDREPRVRPDLHERYLAFDDAALDTNGWRPVDGFVLADPGQGQTIEFAGRFSSVAIDALKHRWSGIADIYLDGAIVASVDLYQSSGSSVERFHVPVDLPLGHHSVKIVASGKQNDAALAAQIYFRGFLLMARVGEPGFAARGRVERDANPYGAYIASLIDDVPDDEWVLDCGGGDRQFGRGRFINFEYMVNKNADVFGDIHKVPFASSSFSLIVSQAVFEHLAQPFHAAEAILDLLIPGGRAYVEVAFLQPVHAVPYHFFNMTDWGLKELFKDAEILDSGWFGPLSGTVDWLLRSVNLHEKISRERFQAVVDEFRHFDTLISHDELRAVASGMFVLVQKPLTHS